MPTFTPDTGSLSADAMLAHGETLHAAGDLSQAETCYRAILAQHPDHARAIHNLGLIALRTGHPVAAESLLRRAIGLEPDMAEAHSNLGLALSGQERRLEAREAFAQAVTLRDDFADAWSNLAILEQSDGNTAAAVAHFRRACAAAPERAVIAANLGAILIETGEVDEGAQLLERVLGELQHVSQIHFNLGKAAFLRGDLSQAVNRLRQAIALEPSFADAHHTLAHALLASGDLAAGWREYEWRWRAKRFRVPPRDFALPRWDGGDLARKRIVIWSEQGVGDKLLFAGLLPELAARARAVTVEIEERLVALFERSFPGIGVVARRDPPEIELDGFDLQAPIGDLPRYLRPSQAGFRPLGVYLAAEASQTADLKRRYRTDERPLVGIAWASRPPKGLPLTAFRDVLMVPNVRWVSVQYGDHAAEIREVERSFGIQIITDPAIDPLVDFDAGVAQTAALDAVVTIQNATLYIAGALGIPTFALTPPEPDWRWLDSDEQSPWHENVRLYRQDREGADAALARLTADVRDWLAGYRPR
jgi:Tfp pilus assembly protein PilF